MSPRTGEKSTERDLEQIAGAQFPLRKQGARVSRCYFH